MSCLMARKSGNWSEEIWIMVCGLWEYGLWIMVCGLWEYGLWMWEYGLWIMVQGLWLWIVIYGLWIEVYGLWFFLKSKSHLLNIPPNPTQRSRCYAYVRGQVFLGDSLQILWLTSQIEISGLGCIFL